MTSPMSWMESSWWKTNPRTTFGESDLKNFGAVPQQKKLQAELSDLAAMEDALEELIKDCAQPAVVINR